MQSWQHRWVIPFAVLLLSSVGVYANIDRDGLDPIELECRDKLLTSPEMAGIRDFTIREHYNWWEKTYSDTGLAVGAPSEPYQDPRIEMVVEFARDDGLPHRASAQCLFAKIPNSGEPSLVRFDRIEIGWENHLNPQTSEWEPWTVSAK